LVSNVRFFQVEGNKFLANIYTNMANTYLEKAEK
jgi:hypothetical protein